jgi:hypothetical protein
VSNFFSACRYIRADIVQKGSAAKMMKIGLAKTAGPSFQPGAKYGKENRGSANHL